MLFEVIIKGGWSMLPLLACSVISLTVVVERLLFGPSRARVIPRALQEEALRLVRGGRIEELLGVCRSNNSALSQIILTILRTLNRPREHVIEAVEVTGRRIALDLQKYTSILGTISTLGPLLGLLGTVLGMIHTFSAIESVGLGTGPELAAGISQSLIATASGLVVAIPSLVFFRFFQQRTKTLVIELESVALAIIDELLDSNDTKRSTANAL